MNDDIIQECITECDTHYAAATGNTIAAAGLDPVTIITAIIGIIMQFCGNKKPAELKQYASERKMGTMMRVRQATRQALREQHPNEPFVYARYNGNALADSVLTTVANKEESKVAAVMAFTVV